MLLSDCWLCGNSCDINLAWALLTADAQTQNIVTVCLCYAYCTASNISAKTSTNRFKPPGNTWSAPTQTQASLCGPLKSSRSGVTDASHSQNTSCASSHSMVAENTRLQKPLISFAADLEERLLMMHESLESEEIAALVGNMYLWRTSTSPQSHCSPSSTYPFPHFWPP